MIVVSDTTPLISLMKASCLDVLQWMFGVILIPKAVFEELTFNESFPEEAKQIRQCTFIRQVSVNEQKSVALYQWWKEYPRCKPIPVHLHPIALPP